MLSRRQDLPPEAFISVEELKQLYGRGNKDGVLPIISISFCAYGIWNAAPSLAPTALKVA